MNQSIKNKPLILTSITALGVVFGDIGTSPLYAFRLCFSNVTGITPQFDHVMGIMSLVFWSITIIISIKYLLYILHANLNGEGGVLALMALSLAGKVPREAGGVLVVLGLMGAALLYGDGMITPAMSVLSAIEGISVATPSLSTWVVPLSIVILIVLFTLQRQGTSKIGLWFGPVMLLWFLVLALLGIRWIIQQPEVLQAINPLYGVQFLLDNGWVGFLVMGFVFLVVTGGEALYADLGHFGLKPIRTGWFYIAMPAILLNYFGQAALILHHPDLAPHSFYAMTPQWSIYPLVILATMAAVIASQAVISGAFSLTYQATRLGFMPRLTMIHYGDQGEGQVYIPAVNKMLLVASCLLVFLFKTSNSLAGAYGLAVSATMVITTLLACKTFAINRGWLMALLPSLFFILFDMTFFAANLTKFAQGGWFPATIGVCMFLLMSTWAKGRVLEEKRLSDVGKTTDDLIQSLQKETPIRTPGTGVFLDSKGPGIPHILSDYYQHTHVLPERVILLRVITYPVPRIAAAERIKTIEHPENVIRLNAHYGFMQTPNIPALLNLISNKKYDYSLDNVTFFIGRETATVTQGKGMPIWQKKFYLFLARNAEDQIIHYQIRPESVLEVGVRYKL